MLCVIVLWMADDLRNSAIGYVFWRQGEWQDLKPERQVGPCHDVHKVPS